MKLSEGRAGKKDLLLVGIGSIVLSMLLLLFNFAVIVPVNFEQKRRVGFHSNVLLATSIILLCIAGFLICSARIIFRVRSHLRGTTADLINTVHAPCVECNGIFEVATMITLNGVHVCARCKPTYLQKI